LGGGFHGGELVRDNIRNNDVRARFEKRHGHFAPQPSRPAGNEYNFVVKIHRISARFLVAFSAQAV
jgi:hypothetical protein